MENLSVYVDDFVTDLKFKNSSAKTIRTYSLALKYFFDLNVPLNSENLKEFLLNYSASTRNTYLTAFRSFANYLIEEKNIDCEWIKKVKFAKKPKKVTEGLTVEQVHDMINSTHNIKYKAILYLFVNTGLRNEELCNVKIKDVKLDRQYLIVHGKGNKEDIVNFKSEVADLLERYLYTRPKLTDDDYLFVNRDGNQYDTTHIRRLIKRLGKNIGLDIHPHQLRHTFAQALANDGADIEEIKGTLRHRSVATTMIYVGENRERRRKTYERSPF